MIDGALQRVTASLSLGPSIFVRARAGKPGSAELVEDAHLFRCPSCGHEPLVREAKQVRCGACQGEWPIENGIFILK